MQMILKANTISLCVKLGNNGHRDHVLQQLKLQEVTFEGNVLYIDTKVEDIFYFHNQRTLFSNRCAIIHLIVQECHY